MSWLEGHFTVIEARSITGKRVFAQFDIPPDGKKLSYIEWVSLANNGTLWPIEYEDNADKNLDELVEASEPFRCLFLVMEYVKKYSGDIDLTSLKLTKVICETRDFTFKDQALMDVRRFALSKLTDVEKQALDLVKYDVLVKTAGD